MILPLLLACAAVVRVETRPAGADVFVTDYPPSSTMTPTTYEARGTSPFVCTLDYYGWENYYVWTMAPGYQPQVQSIHNELKLAPAVGGLCCPLLWVWALGPDDAPVYVDLQPSPPPPRPDPVR